mgnify:CR=1 FL=1
MNELLLLTVAQAQGGPSGAPSCAAQAMPLLLMFAVFYFLLIRPQQKRQREHQEMLSRLKKGDRVVTGGGLIGTVVALTDAELTVELTDRVKVNVVRAQVNLYQPAVAGNAPAKKDGN